MYLAGVKVGSESVWPWVYDYRAGYPATL